MKCNQCGSSNFLDIGIADICKDCGAAFTKTDPHSKVQISWYHFPEEVATAAMKIMQRVENASGRTIDPAPQATNPVPAPDCLVCGEDALVRFPNGDAVCMNCGAFYRDDHPAVAQVDRQASMSDVALRMVAYHLSN